MQNLAFQLWPKLEEPFCRDGKIPDAIVHLSPFSLLKLDDSQLQLKKALLAMSDGPIAMDVFFSRVWGKPRYSTELHANLISSLLYRLRKKMGVKAKILNGEVQLENTLVLS
jgi:hypothetical protein